MAFEIIIPVIGSAGIFELRPPFNTIIEPNVRYTCQAVRRLSEYLANNETPYEDIYQASGLTEADYNLHLEENMYIVSLQSEKGQWIYLPATHVSSYPLVNGIPYRAMMVVVSLPPLPVDRDLDFLHLAFKNIVADSLGVNCKIKNVEASSVSLISKEKHDLVSSNRASMTQGLVTDRARYVKLSQDYQIALDKIQELETYILNHTP